MLFAFIRLIRAFIRWQKVFSLLLFFVVKNVVVISEN